MLTRQLAIPITLTPNAPVNEHFGNYAPACARVTGMDLTTAAVDRAATELAAAAALPVAEARGVVDHAISAFQLSIPAGRRPD